MSHEQSNPLDRNEPSLTALRVAKARAVHQLLDEPIVFPDPSALPILGAAVEKGLREDPFSLNDPVSRGLRAGVVARSRFCEDALERAVSGGVTQYVVLGAGLDTFVARNPHAGSLQVFEVDHPATQRWKRQLLDALPRPLPGAPRFVAIDFARELLSEKLAAAGLDLRQPTFFSWQGVSVYLPDEAVLGVLRTVAALSAGSGIAFDYRVATHLLNPLERMMEEFSARAFAAMGEPWLSSFVPEELTATLLELGFGSVEDVGPEELNRRYFHHRRDGLQTSGGGFRFACAMR